MNLKKDEPVVVAAVVALLPSALALATSFGLDLTTTQTAAITGFVTAVSAVVAALWARRKVTPNTKVPPAQ